MPFWTSFDDSPHTLATRMPDGRDLVFLTGTAGFAFQGNSGSWRRDQALHLIGPHWRRLDAVAPAAALASIWNGNTAVNAGWATDNVNWSNLNGRILLTVSLAVSDTDGQVLRFAYQATAIGILG